MSKETARAVSMMLVGGFGAALFFSQGLFVWAGLLAWASFLDAGGDRTAWVKTVAGTGLGVTVGCIAEVIVFSIPVEPGSWLWIPRSAGAIALSLPVLVLVTRVRVFSHFPSLLYGFAAVFAAITIPSYTGLTGLHRLTALRLYNPFFSLVISMTLGALLGLLAHRLEEALTRE